MSIEAGTKFLGLSSEVDTTERRSAQINKKSEHYTIEELTSHISTEVQNSIEPVDADTIVDQLDTANYDTIRDGVIGYKSTIIQVPTFNTNAASNFSIVGKNDHVLFNAVPVFLWDAGESKWTSTLSYATYPNSPAVVSAVRSVADTYTAFGVTFFVEYEPSEDDVIIKISAYDSAGVALDNTSSVVCGLYIDVRTY